LEQKIQTVAVRKQASSNLWITVLVLCLLLAFVYTLADCFKQQRVQANLSTQIVQKNTELAALPGFSADLKARLTEAELANQEIQTALSTDYVDSTDLIAVLLDTAAACKLKNRNVSTGNWNSEAAGESNYRVMPINLDLSGTLTDVVSFLKELETNHFLTALVVKNVSLASSGETVQNDLRQGVTAKLSALIVTRNDGEEN
jgi:hypothetical protein